MAKKKNIWMKLDFFLPINLLWELRLKIDKIEILPTYQNMNLSQSFDFFFYILLIWIFSKMCYSNWPKLKIWNEFMIWDKV